MFDSRVILETIIKESTLRKACYARVFFVLALVLLACLGNSEADGGSLFSVWEAPLVHAGFVGNGRLSVAFSERGEIVSIFWPSPGFNDHVGTGRRGQKRSFGDKPYADGSLFWGIRFDNQTVWCPKFPSVCTFLPAGASFSLIPSSESLPFSVRQTILVHPILDVLYTVLDVKEAPKDCRLIWYGDLNPNSRKPSAGLWAESILSEPDDFACFSLDSGKSLVHFRPADPSSGDWSDIGDFTQLTTEQIDKKFKNGVWIVYGTPNSAAGYQCGMRHDSDRCAFMQASQGRLARESLAWGQTNSALEIVPVSTENGSRATVVTSFGETLTGALRVLEQGLSWSVEEVARAAASYWEHELLGTIVSADEHISVVQRQCLLSLRMATERYTNALVRAPVIEGFAHFERPQDAAWAALACDLAGKTDWAAGYLTRWSNKVRLEDLPEKPRGSLPIAVSTDNTEIVPSFLLKADNVGNLLWGLWEHAAYLPNDKRLAFLKEQWERVEAAGDFLFLWVDPLKKMPLPSFKPKSMRDVSDIELLISYTVGLGAALRIAEALGVSKPEWTERQDDYAVLLTSLLTDSKIAELEIGLWPLLDVLGDEVLNRRVFDVRIRELDRGTYASKRLEILADLALMADREPQRLEGLRPIVLREVDAGSELWRRDSVGAAKLFIALASVF
ncbi:MAG TPA: hypothetical protein PKY35_06480 [Candidatus Hydrogenedentes bacterium]|nr:hypothetical protein [Candidatus Hydrogenedentota bacterium]HOL76660.1 hypothetical protein [Candidatus Hydrogenedentota bacterium]HPO84493.1 hypothetical protein [Candidatus Hydrogenedentota bacterium]